MGCLLLLLYMMLRWFEQTQVFHPSRTFDADPGVTGLAWEEARFCATDGVKLHGWFFPAPTNTAPLGYTFLVCHGNGGNISHRLGVAKMLHQMGAAVLLFDYRGYGRSEGRPSEPGTYLDARAALAWLGRKGLPSRTVIVLGESLGGGVAAETALREPVAGLVLQSTFTSIPDIGRELFPWLPVRLLATIRYDTHAKLPQLKIPVLILHSRHDQLIGYHHAVRNFESAREPKTFAELAGDHNDAVWLEPAYAKSVTEFLAKLSSTAGPAAPR